MHKLIKTKISKGYQTVVPAEVRTQFRGEPGDEIIWSIVGDQVYIRIKRQQKIDPLKEMIGKFTTDHPTNATKEIDDVVYDGQ